MNFVRSKPRVRGATTSTHSAADGSVVVVVQGELDHDGVQDVENDVRWAVSQAERSVALDCSAVTFVDSAGLRLLIQAQMMAVDHHVEFGLVAPSQPVVRLLAMTGLDDLIAVDARR